MTRYLLQQSSRAALFGLAVGVVFVGFAATSAKPSADAALRLPALDGTLVAPLAPSPEKTATVALFVRTDCPISNRYAPEFRRIHAAYADRGVSFWLIYPNPAAEESAIRSHLEEYGYTMPALKDPEHRLVGHVGARITPEVALFDAQGKLVYLGRIDDRHVDFGKARPEPTRRDLALALDAVLAGKPVEPSRTKAVGCFIDDLR